MSLTNRNYEQPPLSLEQDKHFESALKFRIVEISQQPCAALGFTATTYLTWKHIDQSKVFRIKSTASTSAIEDSQQFSEVKEVMVTSKVPNSLFA